MIKDDCKNRRRMSVKHNHHRRKRALKKLKRYKRLPRSIHPKQKRPLRKNHPMKHRKTLSRFKVTGGAPTWKVPSILFVACMISTILILPTLIVLPSDEHEPHEATNTKQGDSEELDSLDSTLSVAVMRTKSEEIENVPLETYVSRVVASEMPAEFEMEALKSQALAARTFIVNHLLHKDEKKVDGEESDVLDTVQHQVYNNEEELRKTLGADYEKKMKKITQAVEETKGEILTYNDTPITPAFFSTSNGYTENSEDYWDNELPYLRSVESPWDKDSPEFLDQKTFTIAEIEQALNITLPQTALIDFEVHQNEGKRERKLTLGDDTFTGREIREKLELRSSDFTIEQKNNHLVFTTKGYGHGIGMSQYGADRMAKEGKTYKDIVSYYYQDVEISTVPDVAPALVVK